MRRPPTNQPTSTHQHPTPTHLPALCRPDVRAASSACRNTDENSSNSCCCRYQPSTPPPLPFAGNVDGPIAAPQHPAGPSPILRQPAPVNRVRIAPNNPRRPALHHSSFRSPSASAPSRILSIPQSVAAAAAAARSSPNQIAGPDGGISASSSGRHPAECCTRGFRRQPPRIYSPCIYQCRPQTRGNDQLQAVCRRRPQ